MDCAENEFVMLLKLKSSLKYEKEMGKSKLSMTDWPRHVWLKN